MDFPLLYRSPNALHAIIFRCSQRISVQSSTRKRARLGDWFCCSFSPNWNEASRNACEKRAWLMPPKEPETEISSRSSGRRQRLSSRTTKLEMAAPLSPQPTPYTSPPRYHRFNRSPHTASLRLRNPVTSWTLLPTDASPKANSLRYWLVVKRDETHGTFGFQISLKLWTSAAVIWTPPTSGRRTSDSWPIIKISKWTYLNSSTAGRCFDMICELEFQYRLLRGQFEVKSASFPWNGTIDAVARHALYFCNLYKKPGLLTAVHHMTNVFRSTALARADVSLSSVLPNKFTRKCKMTNSAVKFDIPPRQKVTVPGTTIY